MAVHDSPENQESVTFKVVDRRRFTAAGEVKPGGQGALHEDRRRPVPNVDGGSKAAPAGTAAAPAAPQAEQRTASKRPPAPRRAQVDFMAFVASLATQAMAALGLMPEGQAGSLPFNPNLAREYIEIIFMLEERTAGNLTDDEAKSLRQLLSDLRLQYVEATRPPQPPPA
jgi:hypothetical protein